MKMMRTRMKTKETSPQMNLNKRLKRELLKPQRVSQLE